MKRVIATTLNNPKDWDYQDYVEFCEVNRIEPKEEEFPEWVEEMVREYWDDDMSNIRDFSGFNVPVVITGTLGLWDGPHASVPIRMDSVYEAINRCIGRSIEAVEVTWMDGAVIVHAFHHDGCNIFEISALSKNGIAKSGGDYKPHDTKKLPYLYK